MIWHDMTLYDVPLNVYMHSLISLAYIVPYIITMKVMLRALYDSCYIIVRFLFYQMPSLFTSADKTSSLSARWSDYTPEKSEQVGKENV